MDITKAEKIKDSVRVDFRYSAEFLPDVAKLTLYGYVIMGGDKKELNGFVDAWEKKKNMPPGIAEPLANLITYTSQMNGVLVSKALSMPAPVIPPRLQQAQQARR
jgi:hypothetical protein